MKRRIAIILSDTLQRTGLHYLLSVCFHPAEITCFPVFETFPAGSNDTFDYYFITSDTFALNTDYFLPRRNKTVVLVQHNPPADGNPAGGNHLYIGSPQETILEQLQQLFAGENANSTAGEDSKGLSARETDVLRLIVTGITNKEIADKLNISLNTVLTHRKNITSKLGIKTVSGLTVYAIMNGIY
ncbi:Nitrogen regulation protein C [Bacteroidales bacterium Barb6]|nr:Nitrogen regulation protein C [Bacteroidales bacterium Barb6]OAV69860.1 Nitrogen regulation protein C [Bacteroidales bacterium Barb6]